MSVWRERMRAHADSAYVHVIVNEGKEAGASLPHTHAQLYALPFVPAAVARERERFTAYSDRTQGRNLLEDVVQEEVRRRERVFAIDDEAVALCPFGARVPFHFQIVPRRPARALLGRRPARRAACCTRRCGGSARRSAQLPPLNMWVRTAPRDAERFCWRIEVMPRLAQLAGLEIGTGVHLNVLAPEDAAERLRERQPVGFRRPMPPAPAPGAHVRRRAAAGAAALRALGRGARRAVRRRGARGHEVEVGGHRLVPGAHLERPHLRARHGARRATARCSGTCPTRASTRAPRPPTSSATADFTEETARAEPRLDARPVRRGDRPVARHRGPARRGHARLGRGAGAERRGRDRRARARRRPTSASSSTTASRSSRSTPTPATTSRSASTARAEPSWPASRCTRTSSTVNVPPDR